MEGHCLYEEKTYSTGEKRSLSAGVEPLTYAWGSSEPLAVESREKTEEVSGSLQEVTYLDGLRLQKVELEKEKMELERVRDELLQVCADRGLPLLILGVCV